MATSTTADAQTPSTNNRSPSPTPLPPAPLAPGPRATALQKVFHDALAHTLKACSYANFSACFPTPAKYVPGALDGLWRDFGWRLEEVCKKEFANLLDERQVIPSLNELDQLIADAKRRKERTEAESKDAGGDGAVVPPTPPHLHPPSMLLAAHLAPFLNAQTANLTSTLANLRSNNSTAISEIEAQRTEIASLLDGLEEVVKDLEAAGSVLGGEEMKGIDGVTESAFGAVHARAGA